MFCDWILYLHVVSASVLFASGIITALSLYVPVMWARYSRSGSLAAIARASKRVVLADWILTVPSGFIQFFTGVYLGYRDGVLAEKWVVVAVGLYLLAGMCWAPVLFLQIRMSIDAQDSLNRGEEKVSTQFERDFFLWTVLGWVAFLSLVLVFYLMVVK